VCVCVCVTVILVKELLEVAALIPVETVVVVVVVVIGKCSYFGADSATQNTGESCNNRNMAIKNGVI
jgi:hypothetical protein